MEYYESDEFRYDNGISVRALVEDNRPEARKQLAAGNEWITLKYDFEIAIPAAIVRKYI